jgi:hypothetical protein
MEYHDTMFASSDLANTLQERVDISVANGLKKVYIGKPYSLAFKVVTMPPVAAQMMMKAVDFLLLVPYPSDLLYPYSGDTSTLQSTL